MILFTTLLSLTVLHHLLGWKALLNSTLLEENHIDLEEVTIIVAFRNERESIPKFIQSFLANSERPNILFVDDHSEDDSCEVIRENFPGAKILKGSESIGKKSAIQLGVIESSTPYILTFDADIELKADYFESLRKVKCEGLVVLPVEMIGKNNIGHFFARDYSFQTLTNWICGFYYRPISASGANLLFVRELFLKVDQKRTDYKIQSGDDLFLMEAFKQNDLPCEMIRSRNLSVATSAPESVQGAMSQRLRWLKKSNMINDNFMKLIGVYGLLYLFAFYFTIVYLFFNGDYPFALFLILIRLCSEYVFLKRWSHTTLQTELLNMLCQPFYGIGLIIGSVFIRPSWKGRK